MKMTAQVMDILFLVSGASRLKFSGICEAKLNHDLIVWKEAKKSRIPFRLTALGPREPFKLARVYHGPRSGAADCYPLLDLI